MGHQCQNCGEFISDDTYRVFYPNGAEVTACPHCPETRQNGFHPPHAKKTK